MLSTEQIASISRSTSSLPTQVPKNQLAVILMVFLTSTARLIGTVSSSSSSSGSSSKGSRSSSERSPLLSDSASASSSSSDDASLSSVDASSLSGYNSSPSEDALDSTTKRRRRRERAGGSSCSGLEACPVWLEGVPGGQARLWCAEHETIHVPDPSVCAGECRVKLMQHTFMLRVKSLSLVVSKSSVEGPLVCSTFLLAPVRVVSCMNPTTGLWPAPFHHVRQRRRLRLLRQLQQLRQLCLVRWREDSCGREGCCEWEECCDRAPLAPREPLV
jgi:hypothetical protein